jgi:hypothetical protein
MHNMNGLKIGAVISGLLFAMPMLAAAAPNQQACFGQGRSGFATTHEPGLVGSALFSRIAPATMLQ